MNSLRRPIIVVLILWSSVGARADVPPELGGAFASLQAGRLYQLNFPGVKTRRQLRDSYLGLDANGDPDPADPAKAPHFQAAIDGAIEARNQVVVGGAVDERAQLLAWEALEGFLLGQFIAGNFSLLEGLRVAFPDNDNPERPQGEDDLPVGCPGPSPGQEYTGAHLKHLCYARGHFLDGISMAIEFMNADRDGQIRAIDRLNTELFPHYTVFNGEELPDPNFGTSLPDDTVNIQTAGYLLGNVIDRYGKAVVGMGDRLWRAAYFDRQRAEGGSRAGERQEMLDEAVETMQSGVHAQFLAALPLAATLDDGEGFGFDDAYQICRLDQTRVAASNAAAFIARIQAGELPTLDDLSLESSTERINGQISLVKQLNSQVQQLWAEADSAIWRTKQSEAAVIDDARTLRERYLDELYSLTGVSAGSESQAPYFGLTTPDGRAQYEVDVFAVIEEMANTPNVTDTIFVTNGSSIGKSMLQIRRAIAEIESARNRIDQVPQQIQIEKDRVGETNDIIIGTENEISAYRLAMGVANSVSVSTSVGVSCGPNGCGPTWSFTVTYNPGAIKDAEFQNKIGRAQAIQQAEINNRNLEAAIRNLLLQQHQLTLDLESYVIQAQVAQAEAEGIMARVRRVMENLAYYQTGNEGKWYSDPALLFEQEIAEVAFQNALRECKREEYRLAKMLEGRWGEPYENPYLDRNGSPRTLGGGLYDDFTLPESIFNAYRDEDCQDFLLALQSWDNTMRSERSGGESERTDHISLRESILGYSGISYDEAQQCFVRDNELTELMTRRFQALLLEHVPENSNLYSLWLPFSLVYGQSSKLADGVELVQLIRSAPGDWNHRLVSITARVSGNNVASGSDLLIELFQYGRIEILSYPPSDGAIKTWDLPLYYADPAAGASIPFRFDLQAGINGNAGTPRQISAELTPFCDRYVLAIPKAVVNVHNIDDIQLTVAWRSGAPPVFSW